ncbi:hypothetical protein [Sediminicoccus sp. BL-A-41-H5]|uniref:hypothetical protein n=1 Tax=Sediminicoccus sp. BL-A-41-H5 TaxID=3421106 RepID=UPI003D6792A2
MQILFLHQNFPGQYRHLAVAMAKRKGVKVIGLGQTDTTALPGITQLRYKPPEPGKTTPHPYLVRTEGHIRHGQAAARAAVELHKKGFRPDLICAHPGWGEGLFLKDVFPEAKMVLYWEYFFRSSGRRYRLRPARRARGPGRGRAHARAEHHPAHPARRRRLGRLAHALAMVALSGMGAEPHLRHP